MKFLNDVAGFFLLFLLTTLSSCDFIVGVFKGGVYVGIFIVLLVIALIWWLIARAR